MKNTRETFIDAVKTKYDFVSKESFLNAEIYFFKNHFLGSDVTLIFEDRKVKPSSYFSHSNFQKASDYVNKYKAELQKKFDREMDRQKFYKNKIDSLKVGDIVFSMWGCEQTNVNFYKILSRKGMTVEIQELTQIITHDSSMSGKCRPAETLIGEVMKRRITKLANININSFIIASLYQDNKEIYWSNYA